MSSLFSLQADLGLEPAHCAICGPVPQRQVAELRDRRCGVPGLFRLVACRQCGLHFLNPRPAAAHLATVYPEAYFQNASRAVHAEALLRSPFEAEKLHLLRDWRLLQHTGLVLDIGASRGEFLALMGREGWRGIGVEANPEVAQWGRDHWGIDLRSGDLGTLALPDRGFDLVTLWQTLEHLPDPVAILGVIRRKLRPGGTLVVAVPNLDSLQAHLFGPDWYHLDAPRHLYHFSPRTLQLLLAKAGYATRRVGFYGPLHGHDGCYFSMEYRLRRWLRRFASSEGRSPLSGSEAQPPPISGAPPLLRRIARAVFSCLVGALLVLEGRTGHGAAMVALASPHPSP